MTAPDLPIRASILRGLAEIVDEAGGDGPGLLHSCGFTESQALNGDSYVSHRLFVRVIEMAAAESEIPDLGLQMAARQHPDIVGELELAMWNSRTLGEAVESASNYLYLYSPTISLDVTDDPEGDADVVGLIYSISGGNGTPQSIDYGMGLVHRFIVLLNGDGSYGLRSVHLPHAALAPAAAYRAFFGATVVFDARRAMLRVTRAMLARPIYGGDQRIRALALQHLERVGGPGARLSSIVSRIVLDQLGVDDVDLGSIARRLHMHPRALQRSLSEEGTSLHELTDEVRRVECLRLIREADLPLSAVGARLGFTEQSSLTRAVRRWFGTSPSQLRRESHGTH